MARSRRKGQTSFRDKVAAIMSRGIPEDNARAIAGAQVRRRKRKSKKQKRAEARLHRKLQLMTVWGS